MTLYEMCQEWAKLAPDECREDGSGFGLSIGATYYLVSADNERGQNATIFDAVCYWLEQQQEMLPKAASQFLQFTVVRNPEAWLADITITGFGNQPYYEADECESAAHALLGAYLEYLRALRNGPVRERVCKS